MDEIEDVLITRCLERFLDDRERRENSGVAERAFFRWVDALSRSEPDTCRHVLMTCYSHELWLHDLATFNRLAYEELMVALKDESPELYLELRALEPPYDLLIPRDELFPPEAPQPHPDWLVQNGLIDDPDKEP